MVKTVTHIDTRIKDKILYVEMYDESFGMDSIAVVPFSTLTRPLPSLHVLELEYLVGVKIKASAYYTPGEIMPNGKRVLSGDMFPKTHNLSFEGGWDKHKEKKAGTLLPFTQIETVEPRKIAGKQPFVRIKTTNGTGYLQNEGIFQSTVGLMPTDYSLLTGVFIAPVFFKKGDSSDRSGRFMTITQDNKILSSLNVRIEGTLDEHYSQYGKAVIQKATQSRVAHRNDQPFREDDAYDMGESRYDKYNGYNGFDDDTIDIAFNGDPEATWNVD